MTSEQIIKKYLNLGEGGDGNTDWELEYIDTHDLKPIFDAMRQYAYLCCQATLQKAAEKAIAINSVPRAYCDAIVDKESIINKENIVLL